MTITLEEGPNRLRLLAVNDGGESPPVEATVTLKSPPVSVYVDKLDQLEADSTVFGSLTPSAAQWDKVRFNELAHGFVILHGHVTWTDDKADKLDAPGLEVVVYINGARQFPVALEQRGIDRQRNQRAFHLPVLLRKEKNNTVEIVLPSLPKEESTLGRVRGGLRAARQGTTVPRAGDRRQRGQWERPENELPVAVRE